MTRLLSFPRAVVAADGGLVAVGSDRGVWLVPEPPLRPCFVTLGHRAEVVAPAADSGSTAAAGEGRLTVLSATPPSAPLSTTTYEGVMRRLSLSEDLVTAVVDADGTRLQTWRASDAAALASGPAWQSVDVDGLVVARRRALVWGRHGPDLDHSAGLPFARLCGLVPGIMELWWGEHAPDRPNGYLFPLADGGLAGFDRRAVVEIQVGPAGCEVASRRFWSGSPYAAISPAGSYVATLSSEWDGETETTELQVRRWADDAVVAGASTGPMDGIASIAVNDRGELTVAHIVAGHQLVVLTLRGATLTRRAHLDLDLDLDAVPDGTT